jgi:hypothetical protein
MSDGGISVDLSDVGDVSGKPPPEGRYAVVVSNFEEREAGDQAKNPGSAYISWELTVIRGEHEGRKFFQNTSLLPQALFGLKQLLLATEDWTEEDLNGQLTFDPTDIVGKEIGVKTINKEYPKGSGEYNANVKRVFPISQVDEAEGGSTDLMP